MTYLLRMFFYSLSLVLLLGAWTLDPACAQFKDMLIWLHAPKFWQIVGLVGATLIGADMIFSGGFSSVVETACYAAQRGRGGLAGEHGMVGQARGTGKQEG